MEHETTISCWCDPVVLRHCQTCHGLDQTCKTCHGKFLTVVQDDIDLSEAIIIHDHTRGTLPATGSGLHIFFACPDSGVNWVRVCEFLFNFYGKPTESI